MDIINLFSLSISPMTEWYFLNEGKWQKCFHPHLALDWGYKIRLGK